MQQNFAEKVDIHVSYHAVSFITHINSRGVLVFAELLR